MSSGAVTLSAYPGKDVRVRCQRCQKNWSVPKSSLIKEHGRDAKLPDLKWLITECDKRTYADNCRAYYPDLGGK